MKNDNSFTELCAQFIEQNAEVCVKSDSWRHLPQAVILKLLASDNVSIYRFQATIDFPIHLSYKSGHFEAVYKIPKSSTTKINHFIGTLLSIFHCRRNMNIGPLSRTRDISERHIIEHHLLDSRHIYYMFHVSIG